MFYVKTSTLLKTCPLWVLGVYLQKVEENVHVHFIDFVPDNAYI